MLERNFPAAIDRDWGKQVESSPTLLLVIDGLPDRPIRALGGGRHFKPRTRPIWTVWLEKDSSAWPILSAQGSFPDTAAGTLALFGQSPLALSRGPVEALGAEMPLLRSDVALRGNFATIDKTGQVIDRRAGRIREEASELAAALNRLALPGESRWSHRSESQGSYRASHRHRAARGRALIGDTGERSW